MRKSPEKIWCVRLVRPIRLLRYYRKTSSRGFKDFVKWNYFYHSKYTKIDKYIRKFLLHHAKLAWLEISITNRYMLQKSNMWQVNFT